MYILRAVNDAGIVWKEGIAEMRKHPERPYEEEGEELAKLSAQTGQTLAEILQDITGFYPITEQEYNEQQRK